MPPSRREFLQSSAVGAAAVLAAGADPPPRRPPNIIFVLADDLAMGDLGCYGQELIATPHLDRLAGEGTRYLQAYCGTSVCAPSRAPLMTGLHMGHCPIRANREMQPEGQRPLPAETVTVAQLLQTVGYATACCGKWGMGMFDTPGSPLRKGFDHFYGYNCQRHAHSYFPTYLYDDDRRFDLPGNDGTGVGQTYAQELIAAETVRWVTAHRDRPFFLFYAVTLPHGRYEIDDLGAYADQPWTNQERAYAAMVSRLDSDVGRLMRTVDELGLGADTLLMLAGDNGSSFDPASPLARRFGQQRTGLRGFKRGLYEGGLRQAALARRPGTVPAGRVTDEPWAFWDFLPTACSLAGVTPPASDGLDLTEFLAGGAAPRRESFYWELHEGRVHQQAIRWGDLKAVRPDSTRPLELYDLAGDPGEQHDLAADRPDDAAHAEALMAAARIDDPEWPMPRAGSPPA